MLSNEEHQTLVNGTNLYKNFLSIAGQGEENHDIRKREDVFAPVACGKFGNWILVTTQMDLLTPTTQTMHKRKKMMNQVVRGLVRHLT
ncbi:hypothetical protein IEQ34_015992 [Dendrobium chrysotoxum]|uniref:Uncharacterized protein n=1 Tax=Dendrobium chrysotoxum TaxID=161865 RepID=A0AAV7GJI5_DENCH|nr:hypothetical protein IEQ34_015992 [Dendrobium chrysotoxum]